MSDGIPAEELQDLAQAYALGELDQDGLQRLYDLLRSDQHGAQTARLTWEAVRMRGYLRSSLSPDFRALIEDRLATTDSETDGGFLRGLLSGIGLQRPRLRSVRVPLPEQAPAWRRLLPALLLLLILAAALLAWLLWAARPPVTVQAVQGRALADGIALQPGEPLRQGLVLGPQASTLLQWRAGHRAQLLGPATCFGGEDDALLLRDGRLRLHSTRAFRIGLPDCSVHLLSPADATLQADAQQLLLGLERGRGRLLHPDGTAVELQAGQWSDGRRGHAWIQRQAWSGIIPWPEDEPPVWRCSFSLSFAGPDDVARLQRGQETVLVCTPTAIGLGPHRLLTDRPPRQERRITLSMDAHGLRVALSGSQEALVLPVQAPPERLVCSDGAAQTAGWLGTGPAPLPDP